jgi:O-antigen/teichoic acid export membrane protein
VARASRIGVAGNTVILTVGTVIQTLIALITVPLYLSELGEERFGVWVIASLIVAYFGLLDRGLGTAVQNEIAKLGDDARERSRVVWTAAMVNAVVGFTAAVGVLIVGELLFVWVIEIPADLRAESVAALPELALTVPLVTVSAIFQGALMATGRIATVSLLETLRLLGLQLIPLGFVYWQGPDLRWLALGILAALAMSTVLYVACCLALSLQPSTWSWPSRVIAWRLFHYGKWVTATSILTPLLDFSDRVVIGAIRGASAVTAYSIPYNLTSRLTVLPFNVIRVAFPRFSAVSPEESHAMATTMLAAVAAITAPAAVTGSILSGPFFEWWLGGGIARDSGPIAAVLFAGFWLNGLGYVPSALLQAQGRPDRPARFHALELVPFLAVLGLGVYVAGPLGAAIAWFGRALADSVLLLWAASLGWRDRALLATAGIVAAAAACGAVFALEPAKLLAAGVPLIALSLFGAWLLSPAEVRARFRRDAETPHHRNETPMADEAPPAPVEGHQK